MGDTPTQQLEPLSEEEFQNYLRSGIVSSEQGEAPGAAPPPAPPIDYNMQELEKAGLTPISNSEEFDRLYNDARGYSPAEEPPPEQESPGFVGPKYPSLDQIPISPDAPPNPQPQQPPPTAQQPQPQQPPTNPADPLNQGGPESPPAMDNQLSPNRRAEGRLTIGGSGVPLKGRAVKIIHSNRVGQKQQFFLREDAAIALGRAEEELRSLGVIKDELFIDEAGRTTEEQSYLYHHLPPGYANAPGYSPHERGLAIDINLNAGFPAGSEKYHKLVKILARHGWIQPYPNKPHEEHHFVYGGDLVESAIKYPERYGGFVPIPQVDPGPPLELQKLIYRKGQEYGIYHAQALNMFPFVLSGWDSTRVRGGRYGLGQMREQDIMATLKRMGRTNITLQDFMKNKDLQADVMINHIRYLARRPITGRSWGRIFTAYLAGEDGLKYILQNPASLDGPAGPNKKDYSAILDLFMKAFNLPSKKLAKKLILDQPAVRPGAEGHDDPFGDYFYASKLDSKLAKETGWNAIDWTMWTYREMSPENKKKYLENFGAFSDYFLSRVNENTKIPAQREYPLEMNKGAISYAGNRGFLPSLAVWAYTFAKGFFFTKERTADKALREIENLTRHGIGYTSTALEDHSDLSESYLDKVAEWEDWDEHQRDAVTHRQKAVNMIVRTTDLLIGIIPGIAETAAGMGATTFGVAKVRYRTPKKGEDPYSISYKPGETVITISPNAPGFLKSRLYEVKSLLQNVVARAGEWHPLEHGLEWVVGEKNYFTVSEESLERRAYQTQGAEYTIQRFVDPESNKVGYVAMMFLEYDPYVGTRHQVLQTFKTRAEAEKWVHAIAKSRPTQSKLKIDYSEGPPTINWSEAPIVGPVWKAMLGEDHEVVNPTYYAGWLWNTMVDLGYEWDSLAGFLAVDILLTKGAGIAGHLASGASSVSRAIKAGEIAQEATTAAKVARMGKEFASGYRASKAAATAKAIRSAEIAKIVNQKRKLMPAWKRMMKGVMGAPFWKNVMHTTMMVGLDAFTHEMAEIHDAEYLSDQEKVARSVSALTYGMAQGFKMALGLGALGTVFGSLFTAWKDNFSRKSYYSKLDELQHQFKGQSIPWDKLDPKVKEEFVADVVAEISDAAYPEGLRAVWKKLYDSYLQFKEGEALERISNNIRENANSARAVAKKTQDDLDKLDAVMKNMTSDVEEFINQFNEAENQLRGIIQTPEEIAQEISKTPSKTIELGGEEFPVGTQPNLAEMKGVPTRKQVVQESPQLKESRILHTEAKNLESQLETISKGITEKVQEFEGIIKSLQNPNITVEEKAKLQEDLNSHIGDYFKLLDEVHRLLPTYQRLRESYLNLSKSGEDVLKFSGTGQISIDGLIKKIDGLIKSGSMEFGEDHYPVDPKYLEKISQGGLGKEKLDEAIDKFKDDKKRASSIARSLMTPGLSDDVPNYFSSDLITYSHGRKIVSDSTSKLLDDYVNENNLIEIDGNKKSYHKFFLDENGEINKKEIKTFVNTKIDPELDKLTKGDSSAPEALKNYAKARKKLEKFEKKLLEKFGHPDRTEEAIKDVREKLERDADALPQVKAVLNRWIKLKEDSYSAFQKFIEKALRYRTLLNFRTALLRAPELFDPYTASLKVFDNPVFEKAIKEVYGPDADLNLVKHNLSRIGLWEAIPHYVRFKALESAIDKFKSPEIDRKNFTEKVVPALTDEGVEASTKLFTEEELSSPENLRKSFKIDLKANPNEAAHKIVNNKKVTIAMHGKSIQGWASGISNFFAGLPLRSKKGKSIVKGLKFFKEFLEKVKEKLKENEKARAAGKLDGYEVAHSYAVEELEAWEAHLQNFQKEVLEGIEAGSDLEPFLDLPKPQNSKAVTGKKSKSGKETTLRDSIRSEIKKEYPANEFTEKKVQIDKQFTLSEDEVEDPEDAYIPPHTLMDLLEASMKQDVKVITEVLSDLADSETVYPEYYSRLVPQVEKFVNKILADLGEEGTPTTVRKISDYLKETVRGQLQRILRGDYEDTPKTKEAQERVAKLKEDQEKAYSKIVDSLKNYAVKTEESIQLKEDNLKNLPKKINNLLELLYSIKDLSKGTEALKSFMEKKYPPTIPETGPVEDLFANTKPPQLSEGEIRARERGKKIRTHAVIINNIRAKLERLHENIVNWQKTIAKKRENGHYLNNPTEEKEDMVVLRVLRNGADVAWKDITPGVIYKIMNIEPSTELGKIVERFSSLNSDERAASYRKFVDEVRKVLEDYRNSDKLTEDNYEEFGFGEGGIDNAPKVNLSKKSPFKRLFGRLEGFSSLEKQLETELKKVEKKGKDLNDPDFADAVKNAADLMAKKRRALNVLRQYFDIPEGAIEQWGGYLSLDALGEPLNGTPFGDQYASLKAFREFMEGVLNFHNRVADFYEDKLVNGLKKGDEFEGVLDDAGKRELYLKSLEIPDHIWESFAKEVAVPAEVLNNPKIFDEYADQVASIKRYEEAIKNIDSELEFIEKDSDLALEIEGKESDIVILRSLIPRYAREIKRELTPKEAERLEKLKERFSKLLEKKKGNKREYVKLARELRKGILKGIKRREKQLEDLRNQLKKEKEKLGKKRDHILQMMKYQQEREIVPEDALKAAEERAANVALIYKEVLDKWADVYSALFPDAKVQFADVVARRLLKVDSLNTLRSILRDVNTIFEIKAAASRGKPAEALQSQFLADSGLDIINKLNSMIGREEITDKEIETLYDSLKQAFKDIDIPHTFTPEKALDAITDHILEGADRLSDLLYALGYSLDKRIIRNTLGDYYVPAIQPYLLPILNMIGEDKAANHTLRKLITESPSLFTPSQVMGSMTNLLQVTFSRSHVGRELARLVHTQVEAAIKNFIETVNEPGRENILHFTHEGKEAIYGERLENEIKKRGGSSRELVERTQEFSQLPIDSATEDSQIDTLRYYFDVHVDSGDYRVLDAIESSLNIDVKAPGGKGKFKSWITKNYPEYSPKTVSPEKLIEDYKNVSEELLNETDEAVKSKLRRKLEAIKGSIYFTAERMITEKNPAGKPIPDLYNYYENPVLEEMAYILDPDRVTKNLPRFLKDYPRAAPILLFLDNLRGLLEKSGLYVDNPVEMRKQMLFAMYPRLREYFMEKGQVVTTTPFYPEIPEGALTTINHLMEMKRQKNRHPRDVIYDSYRTAATIDYHLRTTSEVEAILRDKFIDEYEYRYGRTPDFSDPQVMDQYELFKHDNYKDVADQFPDMPEFVPQGWRRFVYAPFEEQARLLGLDPKDPNTHTKVREAMFNLLFGSVERDIPTILGNYANALVRLDTFHFLLNALQMFEEGTTGLNLLTSDDVAKQQFVYVGPRGIAGGETFRQAVKAQKGFKRRALGRASSALEGTKLDTVSQVLARLGYDKENPPRASYESMATYGFTGFKIKDLRTGEMRDIGDFYVHPQAMEILLDHLKPRATNWVGRANATIRGLLLTGDPFAFLWSIMGNIMQSTVFSLAKATGIMDLGHALQDYPALIADAKRHGLFAHDFMSSIEAFSSRTEFDSYKRMWRTGKELLNQLEEDLGVKGEADKKMSRLAKKFQYWLESTSLGEKVRDLITKPPVKAAKAIINIDEYLMENTLFSSIRDASLGSWIIQTNRLMRTLVPKLLAQGVPLDVAIKQAKTLAADEVNRITGNMPPWLATSATRDTAFMAFNTPNLWMSRLSYVKLITDAIVDTVGRNISALVYKEDRRKRPDWIPESEYDPDVHGHLGRGPRSSVTYLSPEMRKELYAYMGRFSLMALVGGLAFANTMSFILNRRSSFHNPYNQVFSVQLGDYLIPNPLLSFTRPIFEAAGFLVSGNVDRLTRRLFSMASPMVRMGGMGALGTVSSHEIPYDPDNPIGSMTNRILRGIGESVGFIQEMNARDPFTGKALPPDVIALKALGVSAVPVRPDDPVVNFKVAINAKKSLMKNRLKGYIHKMLEAYTRRDNDKMLEYQHKIMLIVDQGVEVNDKRLRNSLISAARLDPGRYPYWDGKIRLTVNELMELALKAESETASAMRTTPVVLRPILTHYYNRLNGIRLKSSPELNKVHTRFR